GGAADDGRRTGTHARASGPRSGDHLVADRVRRPALVLVGTAARPGDDRDPRLAEDAPPRHPPDRAGHARAGPVGVQGPLVAADGPLHATVARPEAWVGGHRSGGALRADARARRRRRPSRYAVGGRGARARARV